MDFAHRAEERVSSRAVGSVLGLALGDALGAPFRFKRANTIPKPIPAFELAPEALPAGSTTDATAMALNLVRSLGARGAFYPDDLVARHLEWFPSQPPDAGSLTRRVLRLVGEGDSAEDAARRVWEERGPEVSAGNGSVMYCPPLGAAYANRPDELRELAPRLSVLTHYDGRCRTAVLAITVATAALVRGSPPEEALEESIGTVLDHDGGEELEYLVSAIGSERAIDGPDQRFCLFAGAAGLQTVARGGNFQEELLRVVALGGDTGSNAAVAGALLGAAGGEEGLPRAWLERLVGRRAIEQVALGQLPLARLRGVHYLGTNQEGDRR
jgi:ADP-ribosyl-[dinitrogen reductase] hydrolase